jgi:tetratricopeptide (TPR) repeat protein
MDSFSIKLNYFINNIDSKILEKFTIGFYQLLNKELNNNIDRNVLDKTELLDFLNNITSIESEIEKVVPSEEIAFFLTYVAHMKASSMAIEESLPFYIASIKIREEYLNVSSLATAENYQSIGAVYEQSGAFSKALSYYKKSLAIRKELSYVENTLLIAESYNRLALVYYHLEYYSIALGYIEETIRIRERLLPSNHKLLENSYYNYKYIKRETEPRKEYIRILLDPLIALTSAIISRLVIFK